MLLRDLVARGVVTLSHVKGTLMLADLLTKAQARPVFLELMRLLDEYIFMNIVNRVRQRGQDSSEDSGAATAGSASTCATAVLNAKNATLATRTSTSARKV